MTVTTMTIPPARFSSRADWLVPIALIALAFIPVVAGAFRLTTLVGGADVTVANARFFASPIPVVLHIIGATTYALIGAFQFSAGFRRRYPKWHRIAGRILVGAGLMAALSGLWMALFYAIVPADTLLLKTFRLVFGAGMVASLILGFLAIRRGNVSRHQAWMRRAYAIGLGAGTQALVGIPFAIALGNPRGDALALVMGGAWVLNLLIAEWLIRRQRPQRSARAIPDHGVARTN